MINYLYTYFTFRFHLVDGGFRANMNAKTSGQRPGDVDVLHSRVDDIRDF